MAKKIKTPFNGLAAKFAKEVKVQSALEYKATAFEIFSQVIQKTPVDTGRARANWNITTEEPDYSTSNSTSTTPPLGLEVGDFPNVYVASGLDYVVALENGKSKQAPAGIFTPAFAAAIANRRE